MTGYVLDASAALSILSLTQVTAASLAIAREPPSPLWAPSVFCIEVRFAILKLERRGLIQERSLDANLLKLEAEMDELVSTESALLPSLMRMARDERLGFFDAVYLGLALDRTATLISRDAALLAVASRLGVPVIDLR